MYGKKPKIKNVSYHKENHAFAFTLAEVLIALAIIGVIAVMSIGIFMPKIQDKVLTTQEKTAKIKFTKAMEQMALNNKIGPFYQDTEEFVAELGNYLKLAKVCKSNKLADCFGYDEINIKDEEPFKLSWATDGAIFGKTKNNTSDFTGATTGIVTLDGTPMILAWNKKCEILEPNVFQWTGNTNKSTNCIAAVMDINNTKKPNKLNSDVILFNADALKDIAAIKFTVNGKTYRWGTPFMTSPVSYSECMQLKNAGMLSSCSYQDDRWAGAVKVCGGKSKLPTRADLAALATYLYNQESNPIGSTESRYSITLNTTKFSRLNTTLYNLYSNGNSYTYVFNGTTHRLNNGKLYVWSGEECSATCAYPRSYSSNNTVLYNEGTRAKNLGYHIGICKI